MKTATAGGKESRIERGWFIAAFGSTRFEFRVAHPVFYVAFYSAFRQTLG